MLDALFRLVEKPPISLEPKANPARPGSCRVSGCVSGPRIRSRIRQIVRFFAVLCGSLGIGLMVQKREIPDENGSSRRGEGK